jgi:uncharacterized Zn-binding protein involved in type VI secretion
MPAAFRLGDLAKNSGDAHGCPGCPHPGDGPSIVGSPNVNVNAMPAIRLMDKGMHAVCCGANMWMCVKGSGTVFINKKPAIRTGDTTLHCGTTGSTQAGSPNVNIGG